MDSGHTQPPAPAAAPSASINGGGGPGAKAFWIDLSHKVLSAVLLAAVVGFWQFYQNTNAELASLRTEFAQMKVKVGEIYTIVDTAFPRQPAGGGGRDSTGG